MSEDQASQGMMRKKLYSLARVISLGARLFLGIVFVYASVDKILNPAAFAETIHNYQILPDSVINITAIILPWLEFILGFLLILGLWVPGAVFTCNALLMVFFTALLFNVARGLDIDCGCFTASSQTTSGGHMAWYLLRDGLFVLVGLYLFFSLFLAEKDGSLGH